MYNGFCADPLMDWEAEGGKVSKKNSVDEQEYLDSLRRNQNKLSENGPVELNECEWKIDPVIDGFIWPRKAEKDSAGWDIFHNTGDIIIETGRVYTIDLKFRSKITLGWAAQVLIRSGIAQKEDISLVNGLGLIDSSFRDSWKLLVRKNSGSPYLLKNGNRIAQVIFTKVPIVHMTQWQHNSSPFDDSERLGGLGSTGGFNYDS